MSAAVENILAQIRTLSVDERLQVKQEIDSDTEVEARRLKLAAIHELHGMFANSPGSVDEFLARKREDLELEEHSLSRMLPLEVK